MIHHLFDSASKQTDMERDRQTNRQRQRETETERGRDRETDRQRQRVSNMVFYAQSTFTVLLGR